MSTRTRMDAKSVTPNFFTTRIEETKAFYEAHLGFRTTFHQPGGYLGLQCGENEATMLGFMAPPPGAPAGSPDGLMYGVVVEDVDREHERLVGEGAPVVDPPEDQPWGGRRMTLRDPNGILVMLFHPIPPDAEHAGYFAD
ncbi:MAG: VOC family protein [Planctomycetota bacterium]